jgi:hypothetical protein
MAYKEGYQTRYFVLDSFEVSAKLLVLGDVTNARRLALTPCTRVCCWWRRRVCSSCGSMQPPSSRRGETRTGEAARPCVHLTVRHLPQRARMRLGLYLYPWSL